MNPVIIHPESRMRFARRFFAFAVVTSCFVGPLESPARAGQGATDALIRDMERIVAVQGQQGWVIDRIELEEVLPHALQSVCRVDGEVSQSSLVIARERFAALGGDVEAALDAAGGDPQEIRPILDAQRVVLLLESALRSADEDCPVWIRPGKPFRGRQTDRDRVSLTVEGGGLLTGRLSSTEARYGGGGSGRVFLGKRFEDVSWLLGGEWGGAGLLDPDEEADQVRLHMFLAAPLVMRLHGLLWHVGLEVAPVWSLPVARDSARLGGRAAIQVGYTGLRRGAWLPGLGFSIAFEHSPAQDGLSAEHIIRAGFRGSFSWDPSLGP
jgi:hypothetical protein